jgi:phosphatidylethanolamine/phosphatidyl-N-methylethanolamine N-methyltransferase
MAMPRGQENIIPYGVFLRGLLSNPRGVSAPTPSSPALADAIAAEIDPARPGLVLELGPGTGACTAALVRHGIAPRRILAIEQDAGFAASLRRGFPGADVRQGDALRFETYLPPDAEIAGIVCGVPLLTFPVPLRQDLLARALAAQPPGGNFVQLSYSWRPPVPLDEGFRVTKKIVWRNFPPAHVWTYRAENGAQR